MIGNVERQKERRLKMKTMPEQSPMEIQYEEWLAREDRVIEKNGRTFYRIISKNKLSLNGGTVMIVVPLSVLTSNGEYMDENGNTFLLGGPSHISFTDSIPTWQYETRTVPVKDIHDLAQIGDYLAAKNQEDSSSIYKFRHILDGSNEEAHREFLILAKELGITEEDIEAIGDDI